MRFHAQPARPSGAWPEASQTNQAGARPSQAKPEHGTPFANQPYINLPRPNLPVCIIGDLHGMAGLLDILLTRIAEEPEAEVARLVFVGDLIDRGPDSAAVLRKLAGLCRTAPRRVICLMGNHERMLLDFLVHPAEVAPRWLTAGGDATLHSFGLVPRVPAGVPAHRHFADLAGALREALGPDLLLWLTDLPRVWEMPGLAVVHADALPDRPLSDQPDSALIWGRVPGKARPRTDGLWLAHGHVIVPKVQISPGRIAVDTGAWQTGRLSALWLDGKPARVLEAKETGAKAP